MKELMRKLSSRKLWLAAAGIATGVAMAFGIDEGAVATVAGAVTAVTSVVTYILAEGRVDAEAVKNAAAQVQDAAGRLGGDGE